ncbi:Hypoxanthine-guanine phosphoribosyltransferase [Fasciola gigantica]|uniref:Hypoxanthine-guanine phosphoribosyltransferase n=1 Tax=Fasciola gigantica TaxID=46835 RepID=A0A504YKU8_FASGI|nr:Hypoxanthine-guanine phosphoribosyltransferase [Fasciola gigantica]
MQDGYRGPVILQDDFEGYSKYDFRLSPRYANYIESILVTSGMIHDRIEKLALDIVNGMEQKKINSLTLICILKGASKFGADLFQQLEVASFSRGKNMTFHMDFIVANTYLNDQVNHETHVRLCSNPAKFRDRALLVVEDLVDTGTTLRKLVAYLNSQNPLYVEVATLLVKRRPDCPPFQPNYVGFEVPNRFIVGYAIDYNDYFREIPHVCSVNDEGKKHFAVTE